MNQQIKIGGDSISKIQGNILLTILYHADGAPADSQFVCQFVLAELILFCYSA